MNSILFELEKFYDQNPLPFLAVRLNGESANIIYANKALEKLTGINIESFLDFSFVENDSIKDNYIKTFKEVLSCSKAISFVEYLPNINKYLSIQCFPYEKNICALSFLDVTAQEEERRSLGSLIDSFEGGLCILKLNSNQEFKIYYVSDGFCNLTNINRSHILSKYIYDPFSALYEEDLLNTKKIFLQNAVDGKVFKVPFRLLSSTREYIWVNATAKVKKVQDEFVYYIGFSDISEIQYLKEKFDEELKYHDYNKDKKILTKVRINLTNGIIEKIDDVYGGSVIVLNNKNYLDSVLEVSKTMTIEQQNEFINKFTAKNLIENYKQGKHNEEMIYFRKNTNYCLWIRYVMNVYINPYTKEYIGFGTAYDYNSEQLKELALNQLVRINYDFVSLIEIFDQTISLVQKNDNATITPLFCKIDYYQNMCQAIDSLFDDKRLLLVKEKMSLAYVIKQLETMDVYVVEEKIKTHEGIIKKRWEYSYLDNTKTIILFSRKTI